MTALKEEILDTESLMGSENLNEPAQKQFIPHYVGVSDRVKAIFADLFVIGVFMIIIAQVFSRMENVPDSARVFAFVFVFLLYDPLFTSLFGGTIGHFMNGIRVKRENNQNKNILFPLAMIRFIIKGSIGWLSLLTVSNNEKSKAIHDMIVGSVVIYKKK